MTRYRRHPNNLSRKYKVLLDADLKSIEPYRNHREYQRGRTLLVNKALKYATVADKRYAWSLLRSIPLRYANLTPLPRCKRLLLSYRRARQVRSEINLIQGRNENHRAA
ncbi:hypothetical protein ALO75_200046 [Pseudomonas syringae pv. coryli]|uniref:Uncharacterized protein n=1 Tax=Pseudomonas syringae pv. coryli TaxID=317659 RepID=A0A0P9MX61_9PSED|nr:hypothetical protein ALO75_200046 [Pseudomonas syringae pv. coryli]